MFDKETATLKYNYTDNLLDCAYAKQKAKFFKLVLYFGVIIEQVDGNAETQTNKYKFILPIDANPDRRVPLEI
ncbi:MAG: hypothetical protein EZS28_005060 [Streblomastix strix]|uniref:Uncharacterized protein n=1 Tax=Streblomastix strix TaxID=222440 RepID=A0A5J4WWJ8_9EUKA|nr:MAG: hypothetical protein EZS28_005060 [Streblomastix strix]